MLNRHEFQVRFCKLYTALYKCEMRHVVYISIRRRSARLKIAISFHFFFLSLSLSFFSFFIFYSCRRLFTTKCKFQGVFSENNTAKYSKICANVMSSYACSNLIQSQNDKILEFSSQEFLD